MNPTNKPVQITLAGKPYSLLFDLNTFSAFEEVSGQFFLDFLSSIQEKLANVKTASEGKPEAERNQTLVRTLMRSIKVGDLHKFIWAALHRYENGKAVWPFTLDELGQKIDIASIPSLLPALLNGTVANLPDPAVEDNVHPINGAPSTVNDGGSEFGPTDAEILSLMTANSEN